VTATWVAPPPAPPRPDLVVEDNHVNPIPADQRHGGPAQQFFLWFGGNVNVFNVVLGGVLIVMGLTFWQAVLAIAAGTMIGALLIALHASQGPRLGVPQMIQSRAQFGFDGASFLFAAVLILNLGFIAAQLVIEAQSLNQVWAVLPVPAWIAILTPPALAIGVYGYRWVHRAAQVTAVVVGLTLAVMAIQAIGHGPLPAAQAHLTAPHAGVFVAGVALLVIDMLSFGPFVSDYSRYVPRRVPARRLILAIWTGNVTSTIGSCVLGAYLAALLPQLGTVAAIGQISGRAALVIMAASLVNGCAFNAYTGALQVIALGQLVPRWRASRPSRALRVTAMTAVMLAGMVIALLGYRSFVAELGNFLDVLLLVFVPWSAVNLTDYFLIRRGHYDISAFSDRDGAYGHWAWRGLAAYAAGLVLEIPFIDQTYYTGPLVRHLGGADISWIVGFAAAGLAYLALARCCQQPAAARLTMAGKS
jgi:nucleobase:cation symporter-1, NCS1 family